MRGTRKAEGGKRRGRDCFVLLVMLTLAGCGGDAGPTRYPVAGEVRYDGQLVPQGYVVFEPDTSQGNGGPGGGGKIVNGRYTTDPGVVGGPHRVRISGTDGVPVEIPGEGLDPAGSPLFPEYTTTIDLPHAAATHDFEIPRQP